MKQAIIHLCQGLCILAVVAAIATGAVIATKSSPGTVLAAVEDTGEAKQSEEADNQSITELQSQLDAIVSGRGDLEISAVAMNTATNEYVSSGETVPFKAASITKVISAAAYLHQVEQGTTSLATIIQGSTAQSLLQRMLTNSDNTAWTAINTYLGRDVVQQYAATIGLSSYDVYDNVITATDQATLLSKLATGQLLTQSHTALLESFMQHTNNDDLIPAGAPDDAKVYHKYGYLDGYLHDSAIITYGGKTYTLVIMTKSGTGNLDDYTARTSLFHAITHTITASMKES